MLIEGQVVWYRFDRPGTYDFMLAEGADRCGFEVYLDTDLSRPRRQYRTEERVDHIPLDAPLEVTIVAQRTDGDAPFGMRLVKQVPGDWRLLAEAGPGERRYELRARVGTGEQLYVCIFRHDLPALRRLHLSVTASADVSLLLGGSRGRPRLICEDETSGWGADDIELDITVDGKPLRYIKNGEIGDMEQDAVRDLDQWVPELLPYRLGVGFRVIELDDIDPNDIGSQTLPPHGRLAASGNIFVTNRTDPDGTVHGSLHVDADDGRYDVQVKVTTWDEQF